MKSCGTGFNRWITLRNDCCVPVTKYLCSIEAEVCPACQFYDYVVSPVYCTCVRMWERKCHLVTFVTSVWPESEGCSSGLTVRIGQVHLYCQLVVVLHRVLSRLFLGGAAPPSSVQIYPLSVFQRLLHPHKNDGMQSQFVFNNYYQAVIHMQVHSNQLHNSDTCGG